MNTEVINFSSGMDTVKAPHLIHPTEALLLVNVNVREGSLRSVPSLNALRSVSGNHFIEFRQRVYAYNNFRAVAFMNNNMYWTDGSSSGKVLWDGRELPLGIATPASPLSISAGSSGPHKGDFKYTYTFYSTDTGIESAPARLSPYLIVDEKAITVDGFAPFPKDGEGNDIANRYRLYRIGGYLPQFTLVAELESGNVPYTDSLDDTDIDGRILHTIRTEPPMEGLHDFVELKGRLFGSYGAKLYYSALGNPDTWYSSNFFTMPDDITGIAKSPAGLIIFGESFTYLLIGTAPENFRLKVMSNIIGCVARESIAYFGDNVLWLSKTGICLANGYSIVGLTEDKIDLINGIVPSSACVLNSVYYLHYRPILTPTETLYPSNELYPLGLSNLMSLSEGIIVLDFKRGNNYSYKLLNYKDVTSVGVLKDNVCAITASPDLHLSTMNVYADAGVEQLTYVSPKYINGSFSTLKEYEKIRINFYGEFTIKVIFDSGEVVLEEKISSLAVGQRVELSNGNGALFTEDSVVILGIPNNNNKSYSITFAITGVGDIKSIQYSWKPRELP